MNIDNITEDNRTDKINYHKKRFITYLILWLCSGIITGVISALGGLAGASMGGVEGGISGVLIFMAIGTIAAFIFLVLWIYHLVKWIDAKK